MAEYRISGIWKSGRSITHYAFHVYDPVSKTFAAAVRTTKEDAVEMVRNGDVVKAMVWNYAKRCWTHSQAMYLDGKAPYEYLRTEAEGEMRGDLNNLINYAEIFY